MQIGQSGPEQQEAENEDDKMNDDLPPMRVQTYADVIQALKGIQGVCPELRPHESIEFTVDTAILFHVNKLHFISSFTKLSITHSHKSFSKLPLSWYNVLIMTYMADYIYTYMYVTLKQSLQGRHNLPNRQEVHPNCVHFSKVSLYVDFKISLCKLY